MLSHLKLNAQKAPNQWALTGEDQAGAAIRLTYTTLCQSVSTYANETLASQFKLRPQDVVATVIDNSPAWIVLDLALLEGQWTHIPLPAYFTDAQMQHAMQDAGVTILVCDQPERFSTFGAEVVATVVLATKSLTVLRFDQVIAKHHPRAAKITYTSGTTGQPKGVCLDAASMFNVAQSVCLSVQVGQADQHLCILPLATLLENVAGVYASLLGGATVHVLSSHSVGFSGSQFAVEKLASALQRHGASTGILIPELLKALMQWVSSSKQSFPVLKFLAVGGAHVAVDLLKQAQALGLPVYEGYGLSESASVVTLNTPQANTLGSVGKPLPHIEMRLAEDGEILIKGSNYLGYTTQALQSDADGFIATGDIGRCDASGFWYILGRKKNIFITSFGRNVSPEWVESELTHLPSIAQACLFGEAKPFNTALILPKAQASHAQIASDIALLNSRLPDYAQVGAWIPITHPFQPQNGQLTANGRLKRDAIWAHYQPQIEQSDIELQYKTKETV